MTLFTWTFPESLPIMLLPSLVYPFYLDSKNSSNRLIKEDAPDLGLNGDRIGDLVYFLKPPYGIFDGSLNSINGLYLSQNQFNKSEVNNSQKFFGAHSYYLPSTTLDDISVSAPLIISGPGIKKGALLNSPINLIDIAPTLAHLMQIPPPKNSQGKVLYELFK